MQKPWEIDIQIYNDEPELLAGLQRGDSMACTCMLKRFAPRLYRVAARLVVQADEAEDVMQESVIQACSHIHEFKGQSGLGSWLHRIVVNTALMGLRRRKQRTTVALHEQFEQEPQIRRDVLMAHTTEPGQAALAGELQGMIYQAVRMLPASLRFAFVLREIEGFSTREAAEALGITEPALKVRLHRARLALRNALTSYIQTPTST